MDNSNGFKHLNNDALHELSGWLYTRIELMIIDQEDADKVLKYIEILDRVCSGLCKEDKDNK